MKQGTHVMVRKFAVAGLCSIMITGLTNVWAQNVKGKSSDDPFSILKFRQIGPFRGGRSGAVTGVPSAPQTFYLGATGGGVFKTTDGGGHWSPITDGQLKLGSVGAIAVADSDPNIIYIGMGEADMRGNASHGDGVYKSTDAGKTWKNVGLVDTQQIGAVRIDPKNPDIVYVAAIGHMSGPNVERGVFRTQDGGKTWKKVLFKSDHAGAVDIALDPLNPGTLYASIWQFIRKPWTFESGGPDGGLWKSVDGGDTWKEITKNPGFPRGVVGRIGLAVSPVKSESMWALVEAEQGGLFHSGDGGATWEKVNDKHEIKQRAWYYSRIFADPKNADTVYALNTGFFRSTDGGHTFATIQTPHSDNHDMWIAPDDPGRMIESNDGGANISFDGGKTWSTQGNQPTGQFYRVALDEDFPYNIYSSQQDSTSVKIASRSNGAGITDNNWHAVGGGESGWLAPDPVNSQFVYGGSYDGLLTRYDNKTGSSRNITVWPDNPMGNGVEAMKYRFQWSYPIYFSTSDPKLLFAGSNMLLGTRDEGQHWTPVSPDLTRNDKSKQGPVGGPITKDNSAVEYYDTIFTLDESRVQKGLIWVGSDDGMIHLTRDGGKNWSDVTPKDFPEWIRVNCIAASPFDAGTAYVAATMYLSDDFRPFLYKTTDYGKTWKKIVTGIPVDDFTRSIRPDPKMKGLLVAGTEAHLYISFDDGENWKPFQLNLPNVPMTDVQFQAREDNLIVSTQGRGLYILDDMPLLRQLAQGNSTANNVRLFQPRDTYRYNSGGGGGRANGPSGMNPPGGVVVTYSLKEKPASDVLLRFKDSSGKLIREISSRPVRTQGAEPEGGAGGGGRRGRGGSALPTTKVGVNQFVWDMRYPDATSFPGIILWVGSMRGPLIVPGTYKVELIVDGHTESQNFVVKKDPRAPTTQEDFAKQLDLLLQIRDRISQANQGAIDIRDAKRQLDPYTKNSNKAVADEAKKLSEKLSAIENELYQTKLQADEDALNYPIKLNNKLAGLLSMVSETDIGPTASSYEVFAELSAQLKVQLDLLAKTKSQDLATFNKLVHDQNVPAVTMKTAASEK
jgi:photosystem II stability/assembly factor-like uncharacterized protein